ncbi:hypothetical protein K239x_56610 [Planctomycetes bacterium K23_9]|uniref:Uncharacterized protein n=1 Tax=Stieleria marina TaxID=1930275 RepID=A0A517P2N9_9BACT|nr:hypothetical protein K239x_56610 [Planctomycetes bacterium K23_9]
MILFLMTSDWLYRAEIKEQRGLGQRKKGWLACGRKPSAIDAAGNKRAVMATSKSYLFASPRFFRYAFTASTGMGIPRMVPSTTNLLPTTP